MANFKYKTRGNGNPQGKPRVYFCCHPEDFNRCFESISNEILSNQNCAIWYTDEVVAKDEDFFIDLKQMQLFVMPVTTNLLCTENDAMDIEFKFAVENHIPVLPLMQENGLEELFNKKCGDLQFLDKNNADTTAISYDDKLQKYLETVLVGDELAEKIRAAFDAYVFLSYRKKDRKYAQELMRLIHKNEFCRDIAIWYDEFLTPGENFNDSIKEALQKSGLFVLAVTPNLINEQNYIMTTEYPMAKKEGKPILPAELVSTDREQLSKKYEDIPNPADAYNDAELSKALLDYIEIMNIKENDITPEHNFFIGLAYLGGVDVEVDRKRALELITMAAEENLPEAMAKLISMYSDGVGVERDPNEVQKWSKRLAEYYFRRIISKKGEIKSKNKICELFSHYEDEHWNEAIKNFLILVDECLEAEIINELFSLLMQLNYCEYTLFFEACKGMLQHKEVAQRALLMDIMQKSINGIYPPYGPLFWYVPEYGLYEQLLMILDDIEEKSCFTKALALTRDVCWIFGRYNTYYEITNRIDGNELFSRAELYGVRRSLCELFFAGTVTEECGDDVYPRCFNIAEAKQWKEQGQGVYGRMPQAFEDELGLYTHEMFSELGGEYIGIVAAPYDRERLETILSKKSCRKLCGLFFSPTGEQDCEILNINTNHLKAVYVPENTLNVSLYWKRKQGIYISEKGVLYFHDTVCLPDDVAIIKERDFCGCFTLVSIVIPDSVKIIEKQAFSHCHALASIVIPDGVTKIEFQTFSYCKSLMTITISDSVKEIEGYAFENCSSLESIFIPNSITYIGGGAFNGCSALTSITVPDSVTRIENGVFSGCSSLESIFIPNSIMCIGSSAFSGCGALTSIIVPNGVTEIKTSSFSNCLSLVSIKIPDSVIKIGERVFCNCSSLKYINIPDSVLEIKDDAFSLCTSLKKICNCPPGHTAKALGSPTDCAIEFRPLKEGEDVLIVRDGITEVTGNEILNRRALQTVILPNSVIKIEEGAFSRCSSITSITIPNGVEIIEDRAFSGCSSLKSITIPDRVKHIGSNAFNGCSALASITIPDDVTHIGYDAFNGCSALTSITIPAGVTEIDLGVFRGCSSLMSITIPNSVTHIGYDAFNGCSALTSITIPAGVTEIEVSAFRNCTSLKRIFNCPPGYDAEYLGVLDDCVIETRLIKKDEVVLKVPDGITVVTGEEIMNRRALQTVILSDSVTKIGHNAFRDCRALTSILIPDCLTEIGGHAFADCLSLVSFRIPNKVRKIGWGVFAGCRALVSIKLSDNLIGIDADAFEGCCALTSITIPSSVKWIGEKAFAGCSELKDITIPIRFEDDIKNIFDGVDLSQVTIHWI